MRRKRKVSTAIESLWSRQFILFVIFSGTAAVVNLGSRFLLSVVISQYWCTVVISYFCGMATAFALNRFITFRGVSERRVGYQIGSFLVINSVGLAQTLAVSLLMADIVLPALGVRRHVQAIAHLVGVAFPVFTSFLGHKYITFGKYTFPGIGRSLRRETFPVSLSGSSQGGRSDQGIPTAASGIDGVQAKSAETNRPTI